MERGNVWLTPSGVQRCCREASSNNLMESGTFFCIKQRIGSFPSTFFLVAPHFQVWVGQWHLKSKCVFSWSEAPPSPCVFQLYTVVQHVKHFNDVVEFGENQEFTDDFEYLATGLKSGQPLNTRCLR